MKNKHKWSAVFALAAMVAMAFGFASCSNTSDNNNLLLLATMSGGSTPTGAYAVTVASGIEHGTVTADRSRADKDVTVTLTITPSAANYVLGSISVTKTDGSAVTLSGDGNTRTFTMPESNVTVNAMFIDTAFKYASDFVSTQFYYVKDVQWMALSASGTARGDISSPKNPMNGATNERTTDSDWVPGSYIKLEANGTTTAGGKWGTSANLTVTKYKLTLFTRKTDGSGYKQTVLGDSLIILGIDEHGFMTENGGWGTFFYTQKGWADALANNRTITIDFETPNGRKYPTLTDIVAYINP